MAQKPNGRLVKGQYKPICRDCALYFSTTVYIYIYVAYELHINSYNMNIHHPRLHMIVVDILYPIGSHRINGTNGIFTTIYICYILISPTRWAPTSYRVKTQWPYK